MWWLESREKNPSTTLLMGYSMLEMNRALQFNFIVRFCCLFPSTKCRTEWAVGLCTCVILLSIIPLCRRLEPTHSHFLSQQRQVAISPKNEEIAVRLQSKSRKCVFSRGSTYLSETDIFIRISCSDLTPYLNGKNLVSKCPRFFTSFQQNILVSTAHTWKVIPKIYFFLKEPSSAGGCFYACCKICLKAPNERTRASW